MTPSPFQQAYRDLLIAIYEWRKRKVAAEQAPRSDRQTITTAGKKQADSKMTEKTATN